MTENNGSSSPSREDCESPSLYTVPYYNSANSVSEADDDEEEDSTCTQFWDDDTVSSEDDSEDEQFFVFRGSENGDFSSSRNRESPMSFGDLELAVNIQVRDTDGSEGSEVKTEV